MRVRKRLCYFVAAIITLSSCDSNEHELDLNITNPVNVEENAMTNCILESILNEVEYNILTIENGTTTKQDSTPAVKVLYRDNTELAKTVIIDYGEENNPDYLGRLKRGKINTQIVGELKNEQCCLTVEFENFYINNLNISGLIEITNKGHSQDQNLVFEVIFQDVSFNDGNGNTYSINGNKTREWIEGYDTANNPWDDTFFISGITSGINSEGREYKSEILTPMLISHACEFIPSGEVHFTVEKEECIYNFGDGLCDNKGFYMKEGEKENFEYGRYQFRYQK